MIADRVCFVHDLRMKRLRLVSMLGGPTSVAAALWAARPKREIHVTTTLRAAKRLQVTSSPVTPMLNGSRSMRRNLCLLLLLLVLPASAADRTEAVRATEIAFAKAFADRDAKKFFSYLAD